MEVNDLMNNRPAPAADRAPGARFPVLLYNRLAAAPPPRVADGNKIAPVSAADFRTQLYWLASTGWRSGLLHPLWKSAPGSLSSIRPRIQAATPGAAQRRLIVSFDGGWETDFTLAFPLLQQAGVYAEFFINPALVGGRGYMSWRQAGALARAGMSIQSHGWVCVDLTRMPATSLRHHLRRSREEIEDRLGRRVRYLSAPLGRSNRGVIEAALECGYEAVCTHSSHWAQPGQAQVPRILIDAHTSLRRFHALLAAKPAGHARGQAQAFMLAGFARLLQRLRKCPDLDPALDQEEAA